MIGRGPAVAALLCALLLPAAAPGQKSRNASKTPYALILGTVFGPDDRPVYGARVSVRRADGTKVKGGDKLVSDHQGEFALRVPAAPADYTIQAQWSEDKRHLSATSFVHVNYDERVDVGLHLTE